MIHIPETFFDIFEVLWIFILPVFFSTKPRSFLWISAPVKIPALICWFVGLFSLINSMVKLRILGDSILQTGPFEELIRANSYSQWSAVPFNGRGLYSHHPSPPPLPPYPIISWPLRTLLVGGACVPAPLSGWAMWHVSGGDSVL